MAGWRSIGPWFAVFLMLAPHSSGKANSQPSDIQYVIQRDTFEAVLDLYEIPEGDRGVFLGLHEIHGHAIAGLDARAASRLDAAGRSEVQKLQTAYYQELGGSKGYTTAADAERSRELQQRFQEQQARFSDSISAELVEIEVEAVAHADLLIEQVFEHVLRLDPQAELARAQRLVRRAILGRRSEGVIDFNPFGIVRLLDDTLRDDDLLQSVYLNADDEWRDRFQQLRSTIELNLDRYMRGRLRTWTTLPERKSTVERSQRRPTGFLAQLLSDARVLEALFAEAGGEVAASRWRVVFRRTLCPDLYGERLIDLLVVEFLGEPRLEPEQAGVSAAIYEGYCDERDVRRNAAFNAGLKCTREDGAIGWQDTEVAHRYIELVVDLTELHDQALARVRGMLPPELQEVWDTRVRFTARPVPGSLRLRGPKLGSKGDLK